MVYTSDNFKNLENIQSFRSPLFRLHRSGGACGILWKLVSLACQRSPRRGLKEFSPEKNVELYPNRTKILKHHQALLKLETQYVQYTDKYRH